MSEIFDNPKRVKLETTILISEARRFILCNKINIFFEPVFGIKIHSSTLLMNPVYFFLILNIEDR